MYKMLLRFLKYIKNIDMLCCYMFRPCKAIFRQQLYSVHCAGLLDVQNILSADTGISRQTEGHSFGYHLISEGRSVLRHRVSQKFLLCSVLCLWLAWVNIQSACSLNTRYKDTNSLYDNRIKICHWCSFISFRVAAVSMSYWCFRCSCQALPCVPCIDV
jgi:hypothetical protein